MITVHSEEALRKRAEKEFRKGAVTILYGFKDPHFPDLYYLSRTDADPHCELLGVRPFITFRLGEHLTAG